MKTSHILFWCAFAATVLLAAFLRFHDLDKRPMHGDEANQAVKTAILYDDGEYRYDPYEHHGPTLYFLAMPLFKAAGLDRGLDASPTLLRSLPAFAGVLCLLLLPLFRPALGSTAVLWAGLFMALSHGLVYYSRYYIQETLLTLFILAALASLYRYFRHGTLGWSLCFGLALGLMHATKETFIIPAAAMFAALAATGAWLRFRHAVPCRLTLRATPQTEPSFTLPATHLAAALAAGLALSLCFYSSFFTYPRGMIDAFLSLSTYLERAEGTGSTADHDKPFHYYLGLLAYTYREVGPRWTEGLILALAAVGLLAAGWRTLKRPVASPADTSRAQWADTALLPFLACYTVLVTLVFSAIPYKTPWNLLPFLQTMTLLAGVAAARFTAWPPGPSRWRLGVSAALSLVLLAGSGAALHQTWLGITVYPADTRNPYVYAHTSTAIHRMIAQIEELAALHPQGNDIRIDVIKPDGDYWPLPWYLRDFPRTGYWPGLPESLTASLVITEPRLAPALTEAIGQPSYKSSFFALRPGVNLLLFVEPELWDRFIASRTEPSP